MRRGDRNGACGALVGRVLERGHAKHMPSTCQAHGGNAGTVLTQHGKRSLCAPTHVVDRLWLCRPGLRQAGMASAASKPQEHCSGQQHLLVGRAWRAAQARYFHAAGRYTPAVLMVPPRTVHLGSLVPMSPDTQGPV